MVEPLHRLFLVILLSTVGKTDDDAAANQLLLYKERTSTPLNMTTSSGAPITYKEATSSLNKRLIHHEYFMDSMTHLVRERIPERVVHAKGTGAFGYFEVTHDITHITKAKFLSEVGKKTPIAVRFSPTVADRGASDLDRDSIGTAIKFYTEEGNFDLACFDTPMFALRDPVLLPSFLRVQKRNPATNLHDKNMFWDFVTLRPESLHIYFLLFGDRGIPKGYRHTPAFPIHTYQVANANGDKHFVRFHFIPELGIETLTTAEAAEIRASETDYSTRDLYNAIANGSEPSWIASVQILSETDVENAGFDVFDITKVLPTDEYPLTPFGRFVLNENPTNQFAQMEQIVFCPGNLVPGIVGAPDKLFELRRLVYRDAQYYRLGGNFMNIPVNCPLQKAYPYNRDGAPPAKDYLGDMPNYYPNSFNGPEPLQEEPDELIEIEQKDSSNYDQIQQTYLNEWTSDERQRFRDNLVASVSLAAQFIQDRLVAQLALVDQDLSDQVSAALQSTTS